MPADDPQNKSNSPTTSSSGSNIGVTTYEEEEKEESQLEKMKHAAITLGEAAKESNRAYTTLKEASYNPTEIVNDPHYREEIRHALNVLSKNDRFPSSENRKLYERMRTSLRAADYVTGQYENSPEYENIRRDLKRLDEQQTEAQKNNQPVEQFEQQRAQVLAAKADLDAKNYIGNVIEHSLPDELRTNIRQIPQEQNPIRQLSQQIYDGQRLTPEDIEKILPGVNKDSLNEALTHATKYADEHHLYKEVDTIVVQSQIQTPPPTPPQTTPAKPSSIPTAEKPTTEPPSTAKDFGKSVNQEIEEELRRAKQEMVKELKTQNQKGDRQTQDDLKKTSRARQAKASINQVEDQLSGVQLPEEKREVLTEQVQKFVQAQKEGNLPEGLLNKKPDWFFKDLPQTPTPPTLPQPAVAGTSSLPSSQMPGFLKNIATKMSTITDGIKTAISGILKSAFSAIGNVIKGFIGEGLKKIATTALTAILGVSTLGLGLALPVLDKITGGKVSLAAKTITIVAVLIIVGIILLIVIAFILIIMQIQNIACSIPIIGCESIKYIQYLPR